MPNIIFVFGSFLLKINKINFITELSLNFLKIGQLATG